MIKHVPFEITDLESILLVGFAATSIAVAEACASRSIQVVAVDDAPTKNALEAATRLGVEMIVSPDSAQLKELVASVDGVAPSPGVPLSHPVFKLADSVERPIISELDLGYCWSDASFIGVTGTNGKTTVTTLVTDMLNASEIRAMGVGNNEVPLVNALGSQADVYVVEASSFRLRPCQHFRPAAATLLNLAPDHLDWHGSLDDYFSSKAQIASSMTSSDLLVLPEGDETVAELMLPTSAELNTYGEAFGDYHWDRTRLVGPEDFALDFECPLLRSLPHDLANASVSAALARRLGASDDAIRSVLEAFEGVKHRLWLAGEIDGVRYFDDSKATAPHATAAALKGFRSVVLIAGGRNKGLDLATLRDSATSVHSVVAIGEAAQEITAVFSDRRVETASDMAEAVGLAASMARGDDVVLLSPACASFDWYENFEERGRDFCRIVAENAGVLR